MPPVGKVWALRGPMQDRPGSADSRAATARPPIQQPRVAPKEHAMTTMNIVRFRTKLGREDAFIEAHRRADPTFKGFLRGSLVKTGDRSFCMVGEWSSFEEMAAARPQMIALLDSFREHLEDLG